MSVDARKRRSLTIGVTEKDYLRIKGKVKGYHTTQQRLMLCAFDAYTRTYDEMPEEGGLVAVNYGVFYKLDMRVQKIDGRLGANGKQLVGLRHALRGKEMDPETQTAILIALQDNAEMKSEIAHCSQVLDAINKAAFVNDEDLIAQATYALGAHAEA